MILTRRYTLPLVGKCLNDNPLTGDENDPLDIIPISELPGFPQYHDPELNQDVRYGYGVVLDSVDVDTETAIVDITADSVLHDWLIELLPQLQSIKVQKGWKIDKTEMEKARRARQG